MTNGLIALVVALAAGPAPADVDPVAAICALLRHRGEVERSERELSVKLAEAHLAAAEAQLALSPSPEDGDLGQRLRHLDAKHRRDSAVIDVLRQRLLLRRLQAEAAQYAIACSAGDPVSRSEALLDAQRRYLQADCHRIGKDLATAEADLAHRKQVLRAVSESQGTGRGSRLEVARAEHDVEQARIRVDHHAPRVQACIDSGAARGQKPLEMD